MVELLPQYACVRACVWWRVGVWVCGCVIERVCFRVLVCVFMTLCRVYSCSCLCTTHPCACATHLSRLTQTGLFRDMRHPNASVDAGGRAPPYGLLRHQDGASLAWDAVRPCFNIDFHDHGIQNHKT